ncbi:MAG: ABC transporter permease [Hyphomicrobiales bacterium]|nr:ABC transporter permease [Hyphomicrobiales bacterium]MCP5370806.1 ABC transporter permease [Hyphomicrobiales bacterium]
MNGPFSLARVAAILRKEFTQMRRDRLTFAMMIGIPMMQLMLFGYAINTDPRHLPTAVELRDDGPATRAILYALENSDFFAVTDQVTHGGEARDAIVRAEAQFVVTVPENFERDLMRGTRPQLLLDADATDPVASSAATGAFAQIVASAVAPLLEGTALEGDLPDPAVETVIHRRYNPAGRTAVNVVPGLLGIILTMTMTLMTSIALTREIERGTLETLLATPARPAEVMAGKIAPFVMVGLVQTALMLGLAHLLFRVPFTGGSLAFGLSVGLFILVNLSIGFLFSTLARNQMQAMQLTFFFFLPSVLLSGFVFPFAGMPAWAQVIGQGLPNTHFIRIVRAVMLKAADLPDIVQPLLSLAAILVVVATLAVLRYRRTLD